MKIAEIVSRLPHEKLAELAGDAVWSGLPEHESWQAAQLHEDAIVSAKGMLSVQALAALELIVRQLGPYPFDEERLLALALAAGRWSGAEIRLGLNELRRSGIVFTIRKTWGEQQHFVPGDVFPLWLHVLAPIKLVPLEAEEAEAVDRLDSGSAAPLGYEMFQLLALLKRTGLAWTQKSVLSKKTIERMLKRIRLPAATIRDLGLSFGYPEHYPLSAAFVLDMALTMDWLEEAEGGYTWRDADWHEWLALHPTGREHRLIHCFIERYTGLDEALLYPALGSCRLEQGVWYGAQLVMSWVEAVRGGENVARSHHQAQDSVSREGRWRALLNAFAIFGWMELGVDRTGSQVFRWLVDPALWNPDDSQYDAEPLRIQPNGDIVVSREVGFLDRWRLEAVAELLEDDIVSVYRISAASLTAAMEQGWSEEDVLLFLAEASVAPIPVNMEATISEWARRAGKLSMSVVSVLHCESVEVADRIAAEPSLGDLLRRLGDMDFAVAADHERTLRKQLAGIGYPVRMTEHESAADNSSKATAWTGAQEKKKGLLRHSSNLHYYPLHLENPAPEELFPELRSVPVSWIRQMRTYHPSTSREMMELALAWQAPVQLNKDKRAVSFIPDRVAEAGGSWEVSGRLQDAMQAAPERIRLTPDMWEEMMILIPGMSLK